MSYIIKKNEALVNVKLTDTGRKNLSSGKLSFDFYKLGDGEMDYSSDNKPLVNILRPVDRQHDIQYPVPYENNVFFQPISFLTSQPNEIHETAKERGFFEYNITGNTVSINTDLCLVANLIGETHTSPTEIDLTFNENTVVNNYRETINKGDFLFLKFKTSGYTLSYSTELESNQINVEPIPYLMFIIESIDSSETYNVTGATSGTTITIGLDRNLPNFGDYIVDGFIYPGKYTIKDYYDQETPLAYWSGGLLDFTTNCTLSTDDVPVWNMNIITIEDIIGLDNTIYKGKFVNESRNYWGTAINYDYFLENLKDKIGVIHYTNNTVSNFYAEGFYRDTFKLKIPYLMWHKKQFGGAGLGDDIGYTFVCDSSPKFMGSENSIKYYDLVDQEQTKTVVGKVLVDQKIVLIEDQELLAVMCFKANRNWTLPKPKLSLVETGACPESSIVGALQPNEALHVSYLFLDSNGITGLHCENYTTVNNETISPKDVVFEFPKNPLDPTYSELSYLKEYSSTTGTGFKANSIIVLWQKTQVNGKPDPTQWAYFNANNYIGGNGCLGYSPIDCENFELFIESITVSSGDLTDFFYEFTLSEPEIGDVIISINGGILAPTDDPDNLYTTFGAPLYYKYSQEEYPTPSGGAHIKAGIIMDTPELIYQAHYLIGEATTSATIRQDIDVPVGGVPSSNDYTDGIYLRNGKVALTLSNQPNNNVVYVFYNGMLIASPNYGVIPTGTTAERCVVLNFVPSEGSQLGLFYLDSTAQGEVTLSTTINGNTMQSFRINMDYSLLQSSENDLYNLNDFITLASLSNLDGHTFGDETFFYGNIETDIKATIYKSVLTCNVLPNKFISSANPTFNPDQDKVAFTEIGIYDEDYDLVAIGKFAQPLERKYNSDLLIIQATIDF